MQAAVELHIAVDPGLRADQGVDIGALTLFLSEHLLHPSPAACRPPRFPRTFPAPSKQRLGGSCGSHLDPCCCESRPRRVSARIRAAIVRVHRNPESSERSMPG